MKNKILYFALLIFSLLLPLNAQTSWSEPVQLSRDGTYPTLNFGVPAVTVDSNGVIHAFWVLGLKVDGSWTNGFYDQIEYRRSSDGGKTWTATVNLTPEYTTQRIHYMKAVSDSKNNVHLVYMRGSEGYKVMYKKFDSISWSEPVQIGVGSSYLRMRIDSDDRVYATWMIGREAFFSYKDGETWAEYSQIGTGEYGIADIKFDRNNLLYANGTNYTNVRPYLFIYDRNIETWTTVEELPSNTDSLTLGRVLAISSKDTLYVNNSEGSYIDKDFDIHYARKLDQSDYTEPYQHGNNNNPDREMYIDSHNYLHLFEKHYFEGDTSGPKGLTHSIGKNKIWETVIIDSSTTDGYSEPNIAFDKVNNKFYLLYMRGDTVNHITGIYFRSKQNTTSIENGDDIIVKNHELYQNYPNPFNSSTNISFSISQPALVKLSVYNIKGESVKILINERQNKGRHSVIFEANELNSGIYFYRLEVDGIETESRKMLYLK